MNTEQRLASSPAPAALPDPDKTRPPDLPNQAPQEKPVDDPASLPVNEPPDLPGPPPVENPPDFENVPKVGRAIDGH